MKKWVLFLLILVIPLSIIIAYRYLITPTIKPKDIVLSGELKKVELSSNPSIPITNSYVVEISLNKNTSHMLYDSSNDYFYYIYPYVKGYSNEAWDFYKENKSDNKKGENYSFGSHSKTLNPAIKELKEAGVIYYDNNKSKQLFNELTGFLYKGNKFPANVRIYLSSNNKETDLQKAYIVYSHYEKKWGKDVSWAKLFPIQFVNE